MKIIIVLCLGLFLSGCALPGTLVGLNGEQLNALVKMKDAGVLCVTGSGPPLTGGGSLVTASIDKGIKGSLSVKKDCEVEIKTH